MSRSIRPLALALALLVPTAAFCGDGAPMPVSSVSNEVVGVVEGHETLGNGGALKFIFHRGGLVIMHDASGVPAQGTLYSDGVQARIVFGNCVYEGTASGNALSGTARVTTGPQTGLTWTFRVETR